MITTLGIIKHCLEHKCGHSAKRFHTSYQRSNVMSLSRKREVLEKLIMVKPTKAVLLVSQSGKINCLIINNGLSIMVLVQIKVGHRESSLRGHKIMRDTVFQYWS